MSDLKDVQSVRYEHANDLRNAAKFEYLYDCYGCSCCCGCPDCVETRRYDNEWEWTDIPLVELIAVTFSTTGDHVFYVTEWEYDLLKDDPHVTRIGA